MKDDIFKKISEFFDTIKRFLPRKDLTRTGEDLVWKPTHRKNEVKMVVRGQEYMEIYLQNGAMFKLKQGGDIKYQEERRENTGTTIIEEVSLGDISDCGIPERLMSLLAEGVPARTPPTNVRQLSHSCAIFLGGAKF